jgi:glycosyltransferase involved in cell wall biosynthesis
MAVKILKIVQINSFSNGSTGKIMMSIHNELLKQGHDSYVVWDRGRKSENEHEIFLDDKIGVYRHALYSRLTGKTGFFSKKSTKKLLKKLDEIKPDIIHLHNIHGYYINIEMLFNYIKKNNIKVVWTLHDCWSFTGQCPHFSAINCDKWKTECYDCPMISEYPKSFKDNSNWNYKKKKELFTNVDMQLVTPSKWLANLVKQSFLKEYPVNVINNGVDLNVFKPTKSDFRKKNNIENKKIILGVAGVWTKSKGYDDFIELSKLLDDNYVIVLVGVSKNQIESLPTNIIGIERTENQIELAGIYSSADVFFNPSVEETFGLTTIEALMCNTRVIVYNKTALPEIVEDKKCIIDYNEERINNVLKLIKSNNKFDINHNLLNKYSVINQNKEYINLYREKYDE